MPGLGSGGGFYGEWSRAEVGFVKRGGNDYTFALMANGLGSVDFWKLRERLLERIER